jgi:hypothetical protein
MYITEKTNLSKLLRQLIRKSVLHSGSNCPIKIIDGDSAPKLKGSSFHYENKRGDIIQHPNAYRKAWGKPIYIPSSKRIEVGANWILNNLSIFKYS